MGCVFQVRSVASLNARINFGRWWGTFRHETLGLFYCTQASESSGTSVPWLNHSLDSILVCNLAEPNTRISKNAFSLYLNLTFRERWRIRGVTRSGPVTLSLSALKLKLQVCPIVQQRKARLIVPRNHTLCNNTPVCWPEGERRPYPGDDERVPEEKPLPFSCISRRRHMQARARTNATKVSNPSTAVMPIGEKWLRASHGSKTASRFPRTIHVRICDKEKLFQSSCPKS